MEHPLFVCFRDVSWLQARGLSAENVLEYFSLSPFYERTCNNAVLRMQQERPADGGPDSVPAGLHGAELEARLAAMRGVEYVLLPDVSCAPRLFVVGRRTRTSPTSAVLTDAFYVLDGSVYRAPDARVLLAGRLAGSAVHAERALSAVRGMRAYSAASGCYEREGLPSVDAVLRPEEHSVVDRLLPRLG